MENSDETHVSLIRSPESPHQEVVDHSEQPEHQQEQDDDSAQKGSRHWTIHRFKEITWSILLLIPPILFLT